MLWGHQKDLAADMLCIVWTGWHAYRQGCHGAFQHALPLADEAVVLPRAMVFEQHGMPADKGVMFRISRHATPCLF